MLKQLDNFDYQWGQIVCRAWSDDTFSRRLRIDPTSVLKEYDLPSPAGLHIEVLENPDLIPEDTDNVLHLVLPAKPSALELSEEELGGPGNIVAGERCGCHGCGGCGGCGGCAACIWCY